MLIKLQAWDRLNAVLHNWEMVKKDLAYYFDPKNEHIELLMFTTLKDQNEVDIFQKDILISTHGSEIFIIDWDDENCRFCLFKEGEPHIFFTDLVDVIRDFIKVGSSYDHPHLSEVI